MNWLITGGVVTGLAIMLIQFTASWVYINSVTGPDITYEQWHEVQYSAAQVNGGVAVGLMVMVAPFLHYIFRVWMPRQTFQALD